MAGELSIARATTPIPANGRLEVARDVVLSWRPGSYVDTFNVYFGTDANDVNEATVDDPRGVLVVRDRAEADYTYTPDNLLDYGTTYYWRIDEVNDADTNSPWRGNVRSFTTADYAVIDDFESYNDINEGEEGSNRIYNVWVDGYANPNTNGSTIGYPDPDFANGEHFVEANIVHGGKQSGPFLYNNTTASYSEVTLAISTLGGNWTDQVNTLSLWFYGDPNNAGTEQLYVKLNNSKMLINSVDLTQAAWQNVEIPLVDFGIDLTNVTQIVIGLERIGATGSEGILLMDDLRVRAVKQ